LETLEESGHEGADVSLSAPFVVDAPPARRFDYSSFLLLLLRTVLLPRPSRLLPLPLPPLLPLRLEHVELKRRWQRNVCC